MTLERAILATLAYSDHFSYPLTLSELYVRLIGIKTSKSVLAHAVDQLLSQQKLVESGKYLCLPRRTKLVASRLKRASLSQPLSFRAQKLATKLGTFPGILAIYLTGSLAVKNVSGDADIDFMVITKNHALWTTRLALTLYTELFGLRRRPHSQRNSGKLCLNLYLCPLSYALPTKKRSLYTAYELIQAIPLHDPHNTHQELLSANSWVNNYLPNFHLPKGGPLISARPGSIGNILESLAYHLQLSYMHGKITREYITPTSAFFHPHNPGKAVLSKLSM